MLTDQQIKTFQELYKAHFGEEISRALAMEKGIQLVRLTRFIYQPMSRLDLERVISRRKEIGVRE